MRPSKVRVQMLALLLLGVFGVLTLDLAPVRAVVGDLLPRAAMADDEPAEAPSGPMLTGRRAPQAPTLAAGGAGRTPTAASPAVARDAQMHDTRLHVTTFAPGRPAITSLWPQARPTLRSLAQAAQVLGLDPRQVVEWERILADARHDLDDLRYVTDDAGRSWHGIVAENGRSPQGLERTLALLQGLADFMQAELTGGETYAEARVRILGGYRGHLAAQLTPEQRRLFDAHDISALIDDSASMGALQQGTWGRLRILTAAS